MSRTDLPSPLTRKLDTLKGVGPRMVPKLAKLNLHTIEDALYHLPIRYEDRRQLKSISQLNKASRKFSSELSSLRAKRSHHAVGGEFTK